MFHEAHHGPMKSIPVIFWSSPQTPHVKKREGSTAAESFFYVFPTFSERPSIEETDNVILDLIWPRSSLVRFLFSVHFRKKNMQPYLAGSSQIVFSFRGCCRSHETLWNSEFHIMSISFFQVGSTFLEFFWSNLGYKGWPLFHQLHPLQWPFPQVTEPDGASGREQASKAPFRAGLGV